MVTKNCGSCGKEFKARLERVKEGNGKFCSRACHNTSMRGKSKSTLTDGERFYSKVVEGPNGCMLWNGSLTNTGYGSFIKKVDGTEGPRKILAHRWSYENTKGPIPAGLVLDHLCRTPRCVNPEHLEPVTIKENVIRGFYAIKIYCKQGHLYKENAGLNCKGQRYCKLCRELKRVAKGKPRGVGKGRHAMGEKNWSSKLNGEQVKELRELRKQGLSLNALAKQYHISPPAVSGIVRRETWKHVV